MKITTKTIKIGDSWFYPEIHYSPKISAFFVKKGLPDDFGTFSETWRNSSGSSTENNLMTLIYDSIKEYIKNKTSSRKVIVFNAHASSEIIMNSISGGYSGYKKPFFEKLGGKHSSCDKYQFGFNFDVYTEVDKAGTKEYFLNIGDEVRKYSSTFDQKNSTVIPYSDEALEFFQTLALKFSLMVESVSQFFGEKDQEKILEIIQHRQNLIAG